MTSNARAPFDLREWLLDTLSFDNVENFSGIVNIGQSDSDFGWGAGSQVLVRDVAELALDVINSGHVAVFDIDIDGKLRATCHRPTLEEILSNDPWLGLTEKGLLGRREREES